MGFFTQHATASWKSLSKDATEIINKNVKSKNMKEVKIAGYRWKPPHLACFFYSFARHPALGTVRRRIPDYMSL